MKELILVIDVIAAVGLIGLILIQQGKGADIGAAFGSGASQTLFGSRGSANFLTRTTAVLAATFFICNLGLAWLYAQQSGRAGAVKSVVTEQLPPAKTETPAPPAGAPAAPRTPEVPK